jgi:glucose/arabinose dehydrogenase
MKSLLIALAAIPAAAIAQPVQSDFYTREEIPLPKDEVMEVSSIALMSDKKVAVATRRGDVWICEGAYEKDLSNVKWSRFAHNLHEPLGMFYKDGALTLTQRPEVTRLRDTDGDGKADVFETLGSGWGIKGDYHEYAFGSEPDKNGDIWVALCLTGSMGAESQWRGWAMRVTPKGEVIPSASGLRSPGGIGYNAEGDLFFTDNQGPWNGSSSLKWLKQGSFQGNPSGNKYYAQTDAIGPRPPDPEDKSRIMIERKKIKEFVPPAVVFPHAIVGQSPTGIAVDLSKGKFGPFEKELYVGEQTKSEVQRVYLEKVNGLYQGAVFHFLKGFEAGIIPVRFDSQDGTLFVGGSNRGWASSGSKPFTFERVRWNGKTPFEIKEMKAKRDGFEVTFTEPVDTKIASDVANYPMKSWTYIYQASYGSPEVDQSVPTVEAVRVASDGMSVELKVKGLVQGNVHYLNAKALRSSKDSALLNPEAWYTLNEIPK